MFWQGEYILFTTEFVFIKKSLVNTSMIVFCLNSLRLALFALCQYISPYIYPILI